MANVTTIRNALGAQVTAVTGLRCDAQARDMVNPPCAVVLPGTPYIKYGDTMDEAFSLNLGVALIISDAAPVEKTQRALDAYLGIGEDEGTALPAGILTDPTLGGVVHWCEPLTVTQYGRLEYNGVTYFGARLNLALGAI